MLGALVLDDVAVIEVLSELELLTASVEDGMDDDDDDDVVVVVVEVEDEAEG